MPAPLPLAITEHEAAGVPNTTPVVVLVHGSLDRSDSFARVLRRLDGLHTVVYDRRGYHRSRPARHSNGGLEGHIDDLLAVIDSRPAVVIGHSYGGDVALGAALRSPKGSSIVSVAAYEPPMPWLGRWATRPPGPQDEPSPSGPDPAHQDAAAAAERFFRRMVGDSAWDRLSQPAKAERRADGPALEAELADIRRSDAPFDVTALAVPATFGRGGLSADRHRKTVAWLAEHTPGAELVEIGGAAHGAHLTHPDAFAALVRSALARSRASTDASTPATA
ncbi:MAG: alpha/beta hydrolase [Acidimicrobiales bacterium]|jgi:pimeloyl-ACP methyl ester carboxylesterase